MQLEKVRLDSEAAQRLMEAEAAQARVAVAQAESMYKSERAQWVTSLDAQKFEVGALLERLASSAAHHPTHMLLTSASCHVWYASAHLVVAHFAC
jgi:hypothetical protein